MATQSIGCPIADIDPQRDKYDNSLKCSRLIKLKVVLRSGCGYYTGRYCRDVLYIYHKVTHQKKQCILHYISTVFVHLCPLIGRDLRPSDL